jgi:hypothetical protein
MKSVFLKHSNRLLKKFNLQIKGPRQLETERIYTSFLEQLVLSRGGNANSIPEASGASLEVIIFSKDRALQLHALLESIFYNFSVPVPIHILYRASNEEQELSYREVAEVFAPNKVSFTRESQFRRDLLKLMQDIKSKKLIFLVDDIVFVEPLDILDFAQINTEEYVASLRLGDHLNFSYTTQQEQPLPAFVADAGLGQDKISWQWDKGQLDWHYPLSVDGHLFSVNEIKVMLPLLDFKAPNSLEEAMQILAPLYLKRKGIAYKKSRIVNIPCNKVQSENNNISEEVDIEFLLKKWQDGYKIDFLKIQKLRNTSAHQFVPFEYIKR